MADKEMEKEPELTDKEKEEMKAAAEEPSEDILVEPAAPSEDDKEKALVEAAKMVVDKLTEATGLDAVALLAAVETHLDLIVEAIKGEGGSAELSVQALSEQVKALSAEVKTFREKETKALSETVDAEIKVLVEGGRILPGAKESFKRLALSDYKQFKSICSGLPTVVPMGKAKVVEPKETDFEAMAIEETPQIIALSAQLKAYGKSPEEIKTSIAAFVRKEKLNR